MRRLTAESPESKSPDLTASNLSQLKALLPDLVAKNKAGIVVNVDVLKQLVSDKVITDSKEKYGLNESLEESLEHLKQDLRMMSPRPTSPPSCNSTALKLFTVCDPYVSLHS